MRVPANYYHSRFGKPHVAHLIFGLALVVSLWSDSSAIAQGLAVSGPRQIESHTTMVIFKDRKMQDRDWRTLFDSIRKNVAEGAAETPAIAGRPEVIRGDAMEPDRRIDEAVIVFLHGDCDLEPLARRKTFGVPLGWVFRVNGRIQPFVHVDCTRIGQVLGPQAEWLDRDRRNTLMGVAIARVILHEWVHIATQSSSHAERGISKAQFGVEDLTAGAELPVARMRSPW